jgi:hypothetical protein
MEKLSCSRHLDITLVPSKTSRDRYQNLAVSAWAPFVRFHVAGIESTSIQEAGLRPQTPHMSSEVWREPTSCHPSHSAEKSISPLSAWSRLC